MTITINFNTKSIANKLGTVSKKVVSSVQPATKSVVGFFKSNVAEFKAGYDAAKK